MKSPPDSGDAREAKETPLASVLQELEGLQAPAGVDADVFSQLKDELRNALLKAHASHASPAQLSQSEELPSNKISSTPPTGDANKVTDLACIDNGDGTFTLTWTYKNRGDYGQDGTVGIEDISTLAEHFFHGYESPGVFPDALDAVIDTSGDGVVEIADVTAVAENLFANVSRYVIQGADSPDGEFSDIGEVAFSAPAPGEVKVFSEPLPETAFRYIRVVPVDDEGALGEGSSTSVKNRKPVANLSAEPDVGGVPLTVSFNATLSFDVDGEIAKFEWDFEGDGVYELDTGTTPTAQHTYEQMGSFAATVRVTDNDGATAEDSVTITVTEPNEPPVAILTANPTSGDAPLTVTFDASASYDPDGEIVRFEWAPRSEVYEINTGVIPTASFTYRLGGTTYTAKVKVTDNLGLSSIAEVPITLNPDARGDWWMYRRDPSHRAQSPFTGPDVPVSKWYGGVQVLHGASPVWARDGTSYAVVAELGLVAFAPDGTIKWSLRNDGPADSTPAIGPDGTIYWTRVVGEIGSLCAINPDGTVKWSHETGFVPFSGPTLAQLDSETVAIYVGGSGGNLYIFTEEGDLLETINLGGPVQLGVTVNEKWLEFYVVAGGKLWCFPLDGGGGTPLWTMDGFVDYISETWTIPVLSNDSSTIYVGNMSDLFYAIDRSTQKVIWQVQLPEFTETRPAIAPDGTIYVRTGMSSGARFNQLHAISREGEVLWTYQFTPMNEGGDPCVDANGTVYIAHDDYYLYAFNPDGSEKWRYPFSLDDWYPVEFHGTPAIGPGKTIHLGDLVIEEQP